MPRRAALAPHRTTSQLILSKSALAAISLPTLFPEVTRRPHPAGSVFKIRRDTGFTESVRTTRVDIADEPKALSPLSKFFTQMRPRVRNGTYFPLHYPPYALAAARMERPLLSPEAIERDYDRIRAAHALPITTLDRLSGALAEVYPALERFSFDWKQYPLRHSSSEDRERYHRRAVLYLHALVSSLTTLKKEVEACPHLSAKLAIVEAFERIENRPIVAPFAQFFTQHPFDLTLLPNTQPASYRRGHFERLAIEHSTRFDQKLFTRDVLELMVCFNYSLEEVIAGIEDDYSRWKGSLCGDLEGTESEAFRTFYKDELEFHQNRRNNFLRVCEVMRSSEPLISPLRAFADSVNLTADSAWLTGMVERVMRHTSQLEHTIAGARMLHTGHYSIPETSRSRGVINLQDLWNPPAGTPETQSKFSVSLAGPGAILGVTGGTESGKSTLIEAVPLAIRYHGAALPIPAGHGSCLSLFGELHTITPKLQDELTDNESHHTGFVRELRDLTDKACPNEVVLIDEGHMGARFPDLVAIAETLIPDLRRRGATVLYATHLREVLHRLASRSSNHRDELGEVALYHLTTKSTKGGDGAFRIERTLSRGVANQSYSFATLRSAGVPGTIIDDALKIFPRVIAASAAHYALIAPPVCEECSVGAVDSRVLPVRSRQREALDSETRSNEEARISRLIGSYFAPKYFLHPHHQRGLSSFHPINPRWYTIDQETLVQWQRALFAPFDDVWCKEQSARVPLPTVLELFEEAGERRQAVFEELFAADLIDSDVQAKLRLLHSQLLLRISYDRHEQFSIEETESGAHYLPHTKQRLHALWYKALRIKLSVADTCPELMQAIDFSIGAARAAFHHKLTPVKDATADSPFALRGFISPNLDPKVVRPVSLVGTSATPQFMIIGPQHTGKTELLKSIRAAANLRERGLPVPADEAILAHYDRVFSLFGSRQDRATGQSYFRSLSERLGEMLNSVTPRSLVILDELHGADYFDLAALLPAILKHLETIGCTVFVNSHMIEGVIAALEELPSLHFARTTFSINDEGTIVPLYGVEQLSGEALRDTQSYGIETVRHLLTPEQFAQAKAIRAQIMRRA